MKTQNVFLSLILGVSTGFGFIACSNAPVSDEELLEKSASLTQITSYPVLVSDEADGIVLMREEEKMAHDVYAVFAEKYDLAIFSNIAASETNHYNAVGNLLTVYELSDPSTGVAGTFTNNAIANLYQQLVDAGSISLTEALKTGAFIEEYDIADLKKLIDETENDALVQVYSNLLRGSRNHLRAFVSSLENYQLSYEPQILSTEDFDAIINSPSETGNGNAATKGSGNSNRQAGGLNGNSSGNAQGNGTGDCVNS